MTHSMGFYGCDYSNPAIAAFAEQFETQAGTCTLTENDQSALVAVLGVWGWGLRSGLFDDFWGTVNDAIGDGIETSMEADDGDDLPDEFNDETAESFSPMRRALEAVCSIKDSAQIYSLMTWILMQ